MSEGVIQIYYGDGHGKSMAALGDAIHAAAQGKSVMVIQFLKRKDERELAFLERLEPEIKFFRFAKADESFEELDEGRKQEEIMNLRNGFMYGKKVVSTGACDLVIFDELLGILDEKVVSAEEIKGLFSAIPEGMRLICTGRVLNEELSSQVDEIVHIAQEK